MNEKTPFAVGIILIMAITPSAFAGDDWVIDAQDEWTAATAEQSMRTFDVGLIEYTIVRQRAGNGEGPATVGLAAPWVSREPSSTRGTPHCRLRILGFVPNH